MYSIVDTVTYFGGNHGSRVWKSLKLKKVYFPRTWTSWDKYMFNRIVFFKFYSNFKIGLSFFFCAEKYTAQSTHCALQPISIGTTFGANLAAGWFFSILEISWDFWWFQRKFFFWSNATLYPFYTPRDFLPACIIQTYFTNHFNFLLNLRLNGSFNEKN